MIPCTDTIQQAMDHNETMDSHCRHRSMWGLLRALPVELGSYFVVPFLCSVDFARFDTALVKITDRKWLQATVARRGAISLEIFERDDNVYIPTKQIMSRRADVWEWFWKREIVVDRIEVLLNRPNALHEIQLINKNLEHVRGTVSMSAVPGINEAALAELSAISNAMVRSKISSLRVSVYGCEESLRTLSNILCHLRNLHWSIQGTEQIEILENVILQNIYLEHVELDTFSSRVPACIFHALTTRANTLTTLIIRAMTVADADMILVASTCKKLMSVTVTEGLGGEGLSLMGMTALAQGCTELQHVTFHTRNQFEHALTMLAKHCQKLKSCTSRVAAVLTAETLSNLSENCPQFTNLIGAFHMRASEVHQFAPLLERLESCTFSTVDENDCARDVAVSYLLRVHTLTLKDTTSETLAVIAQNCHALVDLKIACRCNNNLAPQLVEIIRGNPNLQRFSCDAAVLNDDLLFAFAQCCPKLQRVDVRSTVPGGLSDAAVMALAKSCHQLYALRFLEGESLTDSCVAVLAENSRNLSTIHFRACPNISNSALAQLMKQCRKLNCLTVPSAHCSEDLKVDMADAGVAVQVFRAGMECRIVRAH